MTVRIAAFLLVTGCSSLAANAVDDGTLRGPGAEGDADTDTDADTDADADADTDSDTDADTDADADADSDTDADADADSDADADTGSTADTALPGETGDTGAVLPTEILGADVSCLGADLVVANALATATDGTALLNLWETGAPIGLGWNEEHDLILTAAGPPESLDRTLADVSVAGGYVRNVSSLFECTYQFAAFSGSLTAAVRVFDPISGTSACWIWGDDPALVMAGGFVDFTPVTAEAELATCTVVP